MASRRKGNRKKQPVLPVDLATSKIARWLGPTNLENLHLSWRLGKADLDGPYHCNEFSLTDFQQLWNRLRAFEGMNHAALRRSGSLHRVPVIMMSKEAKERLKTLQLDDIDVMYSFHIDGPCRMWCIKYQSIFLVLWWDRNHGAYSVRKKHT